MIRVRAERELNGNSNGTGAIFAQLRGFRVRGHLIYYLLRCITNALVRQGNELGGCAGSSGLVDKAYLLRRGLEMEGLTKDGVRISRSLSISRPVCRHKKSAGCAIHSNIHGWLVTNKPTPSLLLPSLSVAPLACLTPSRLIKNQLLELPT